MLFIALAIVLANGVHLPKIDLPGLKVSEFYIKLDKKFIIEIDRVVIGKTEKKENTAQELDDIGTVLRFVPHLFEKIQINEIVAGGETASVLFYDGIFYIETSRLQLATQIYYDEAKRVLFAKIHTLYLVEPDTIVRGRFAYDPKHGVWRGDGTYDGLNMKGRFTIWRDRSVIGFEIDSEPTDSIKPLVDFLAPPEPIKVWIYPKIPAKRYVLHYLRGQVELKNDGSVAFDPEKVEGFATAYDADIHFHPKVPPVHARQIDVTYRHDTLGFKLYEPVYEKKRLDGSFVRIRNLVGKKGPVELDAHIVIDDRFDASIRKILMAYRIPVPFVQTKGRMKGVTDLTVALKTGRITSYRGDYRAKSAVLLFDNVLPVPVENLHVTADKLRFAIAPCTVRLKPYLQARLEGTLDLGKKRGDFDATLERFDFAPGGTPLLSAKGDTLHVTMDFKKEILFTAPSLAAKVRYMPGGGMVLSAEDLSRLKPFFRGPLAPIEGGSLHATFKKGHGDLKADLRYPNEILKYKNKPLENLHLTTRFGPEGVEADLNGLATLQKRGKITTIRCKNLDINIVRLRKLVVADLQKSGGEKEKSEPAIVRIYGANTILRGDYAYLPCDSYEMKVTTQPLSALFESKHGAGTIYGLFYNDDIKIVGKHLPDTVIHGIPALDDLYGGYFDFDAVGKFDDFNGTITFQDTLWAKSAVYNNMLATLNSIPSLLTLKNPGFNQKGYKIKKGTIDYHYKSPVFHFDKIAIHGESANIFGQGDIDFAKETINVKMRVQFLQTVSQTMKNIPIAGYILFGDDGTVSVGLSIEGTLKNPKVETSAAKDIVTAPLNIIKRTFTFPFHLFK